MHDADKPKVDFIGIGFPRCGTTWLGACLDEHPEICFSDPKEVHFFDLDYHYEQGGPFYAKHFICKPGERVVGEFTPEYIRDPERCAGRIHGDYPQAKLIVVMRDPVLRAFSHYGYRKNKAGTYSSFREVIDNVATDPIVSESDYLAKLEPFLARFDRQNMLFLVHEAAAQDRGAYVRRVYEFLGVDPTFIPPSLERRVNTTNTQTLRFRRIEQFVNRLRWALRGSAVGRAVLIPVRAIGITKAITWLRVRNRIADKNPEQLRQVDYDALWKYFTPKVRELEARLALDTSAYWGKYRSEA